MACGLLRYVLCSFFNIRGIFQIYLLLISNLLLPERYLLTLWINLLIYACFGLFRIDWDLFYLPVSFILVSDTCAHEINTCTLLLLGECPINVNYVLLADSVIQVLYVLADFLSPCSIHPSTEISDYIVDLFLLEVPSGFDSCIFRTFD